MANAWPTLTETEPTITMTVGVPLAKPGITAPYRRSRIAVFSKDDDDMPYISMNTERYYQTFEIASKINGDKDKSLLSNNVKGFTDVWEDCFHKAFKEDRLLFYFTGLNRCTLLRSMETDFGILPVPKYDEAQTGYYNLISLWSANGFSVPKTVSDLDRTSIIEPSPNQCIP